jgi:hypothetical protein
MLSVMDETTDTPVKPSVLLSTKNLTRRLEGGGRLL